jgi:hypothetical protein
MAIPEGSGHFQQGKAMQKTRIQLGLLIAMTGGIAFGQIVPWAGTAISSATANFAVNPPTLTINGQNFGAVPPTVTLGGTRLTVQSFTPSVVVATLPPGANQGSYQLVLVNNQSPLRPEAVFDVTLGAAGAAGPSGPAGPLAPNTQAIALLKWYPARSGVHFAVGNFPTGLAFDGASIWVATGDNTVTKLRASDGTNLGTFNVGANPQGVAFDGANIWVGNSFGNTGSKL